jgi:hypothetical protein
MPLKKWEEIKKGVNQKLYFLKKKDLNKCK